MIIAKLAAFASTERDFDIRWRLVTEFLKEYHQEPVIDRPPNAQDRTDRILRRSATDLARWGRVVMDA